MSAFDDSGLKIGKEYVIHMGGYYLRAKVLAQTSADWIEVLRAEGPPKDKTRINLRNVTMYEPAEGR
jgi:hypothetical protein